MWVFGWYSECSRSNRFDGGRGRAFQQLKKVKEALLKLTDSGKNAVSQ